MQLRWRHVIINTHSSWLPGSQKGFRSRDHRIHSSGDYKRPPPPGEHDGLLQYHRDRASPKVEIPSEFRGMVGASLIQYFRTAPYELSALSVSDLHAHFLVDLPEELPMVKEIVGRAKERASRVLNKRIDGFRWAAGGTYKFVADADHLSKAAEYILTRQGPSAWTWCPRCGDPDPNPHRRCPCNHDH